MVWRGIFYDVIFLGTLNVKRFNDNILTLFVLPFDQRNHNGIYFQQDNAAPHTARLTTNLFLTNNINSLDCPDLNPIAHVWDLLIRRIRKAQGEFHNLQELENAMIR